MPSSDQGPNRGDHQQVLLRLQALEYWQHTQITGTDTGLSGSVTVLQSQAAALAVSITALQVQAASLQSQVTNLQSQVSALGSRVTTLVSSPGIAVNAAQWDIFILTVLPATGMLQNPSGASDGATITFRLIQSQNSLHQGLSPSYGTSYDFGVHGIPQLSLSLGSMDILTFQYAALRGKWCFISISSGF